MLTISPVSSSTATVNCRHLISAGLIWASRTIRTMVFWSAAMADRRLIMAGSPGRAQQLGEDLLDRRRIGLALALAHHLAHEPFEEARLGFVGGDFLRVFGQHLA